MIVSAPRSRAPTSLLSTRVRPRLADRVRGRGVDRRLPCRWPRPVSSSSRPDAKRPADAARPVCDPLVWDTSCMEVPTTTSSDLIVTAFLDDPTDDSLSASQLRRLAVEFASRGHEVDAVPTDATDVVFASAQFGVPIGWRQSLQLTVRRRFKLRKTPITYVVMSATREQLQAQIDHFHAALAKSPDRSGRLLGARARADRRRHARRAGSPRRRDAHRHAGAADAGQERAHPALHRR